MYRGTREKDAETVIVRTIREIEEAIKNKQKMKLDLFYFNPLELKEHSSVVTVGKLLELINDDNPIQRLKFVNHKWSTKDLKSLNTLLTNTQYITEIELGSPNNAIKTIFKALESNTSVKQISILIYRSTKRDKALKYYQKLCDGLLNKTIRVEAIEIRGEIEFDTTEFLDLVFEALKQAKSITSFKTVELTGDCAHKIADLLKQNQRITSVVLDKLLIPEEVVPKFVEIINMNHLKQFHFENNRSTSQENKLLFRSLTENTSITDLAINYAPITVETLEVLLKDNMAIEKLNVMVNDDDLIDVVPVDDSIVDALAKNTSLTSLTITNVPLIEKALLRNTTLKSLCLADSQLFLDGDLTKRILEQNATLTALDITCNNQNDNKMDFDSIIEGLASNRTLQSFSCKLELLNEISRKNFCAMLRDHQSLTQINTQPITSLAIFRMVLPGFVEMIEEAIQANLSLRSWSPYDSFEQFKPYFKRNIELQEDNIRRTKTIIRMILLKPHSFLLPIEIWSHIFHQLRYPGIDIDFGKCFFT